MKRKKNIQTMSPEAAEYMENLWEVWQQWQSAKSMFEQAVDPDMVEFAIYNMEARKKQFNYMVKYARENLDIDPKALALIEQGIY
ncbi:MAG: DUF2508 family protein [Clostridiales bacterium]|jgi:hypothetical protein|nr:DUF2508 family protein [Clostridiales bacterium]